MAEQTRSNPIRTFLVEVVLVVVTFTVIAYVVLYMRTETLVTEGALAQARSYVDLIMRTRSWNAHYEGVWVLKGPGVETNPYLEKLGVPSEMRTTDGQVLTLRNPALMTREISDSLVEMGGVSFTLTSLRPVNPDNAPDAWERQALQAFAHGMKESWETTAVGGVTVLRYTRPLATEEACLTCHASQGYKVGDIRGAVSVTVPLLSEEQILRDNAVWLGVMGVIGVLIVIGLTLILVRRLSSRLEEAESALVRMATTDDLTHLRNRRAMFGRLHEEVARARRTGKGLGIIMLDLDHFKPVNDEHGHAVGDQVLETVADRMREAVRDYDALGRIGGEEFLVVAPDVDLDAAAALAERVREAVSRTTIEHGGSSIPMTLSAGVTTAGSETWLDGDAEADHALARADDALYEAKRAGRDRVVAKPVEERERASRPAAGRENAGGDDA